jgi:RNA polymerase sigma factor (sigma-70 family)
MPTSVIEHLRRVVGAGLRDGELLGHFVERHDEAALAALVNRHGRMVWGVCRRLLGHHDAEDAFQATFLVLVRKASSIVPREMVGNWLYGVAHQTALQARRSAARRRAREVQVTQMPDTADIQQDRWPDLPPVLDQELSRLPDHYRAVIVLSDLEGKSRKEVAAQLGCPEGTVASRLARARSMLARRLTQRGIALSGGALAAALSQNAASAGVPTSLVCTTIKAVSLIAAGRAAIPVKVAALAEEVLKTMLVTKLKNAMAMLAVAAIVGLIGFGFAIAQQKGDEVVQKQTSENKTEDPVVKENADEAIAWGKEVDGLQMGLAGADPGRQGETIKLTVKLRNVSKADIKFTHALLREYAPEVTAADGVAMRVYMPLGLGIKVRLEERVIKPGETITLYNPELAVQWEAVAHLQGLIRVDTPTICVKPGNYKIAYGRMIQSHPKLTTGTAEFEVKAAQAESVTAWGKEVGGLQAGLGFHPGQKRAYRHGETVPLVVRVRNVSQNNVKFYYHVEFLEETTPAVTDANGNAIPVQRKITAGGIQGLGQVDLAPGKETELYELRLILKPASEQAEKMLRALYGTGTFQIQYKQVDRIRSATEELYLDEPILDKLATGKLELEVKDEPAEKK